MIEVKNLSVQTSKGVVLLDHVEFTLTPGVCTGLTGASGSGKTTLLKALMGVSDGDVSINSGQILLDGEDLLKKPEKVRRDLCGTTLVFIPQNPMTAFNLHVPVGTQMSETFRKRLRLDKNAARKLSMDVLQKVNLLDTNRVYRSYPGQLSGGMLQRATMAILIGLSPRYIFADEPTSALDEENKAYLNQELTQMKQKAAILFVSHDDAAIRTLCDELLVMQSGIIVERGTTADLFATPHKEWTKEFVRLEWSRKPHTQIASSRCLPLLFVPQHTLDQRRQIIFIRRIPAQAVIVGLDPAKNQLADLFAWHRSARQAVDQLLFQRCEKALHPCIVKAAVRAPHALTDRAILCNQLPIFPAGVLTAMVGMQDHV